MLTGRPSAATSTRSRLGGPLLVAAGAALAAVAIWFGDPTTPGGPLPVCPVKWLLGIDCPGCGGMRMVYCLLHGDLIAAARFNALGLVALALFAVAYAAWVYGRVVGRQVWSWQHHRWAPTVAVVLLSAWFVVRNIPVAPFTALHV